MVAPAAPAEPAPDTPPTLDPAQAADTAAPVADTGGAQEELDAQLAGLEGLAWHRENVRKSDQPELDLGGE